MCFFSDATFAATRREEWESRVRSRGGEELPNPARVPGVMPAEWSRRLQRFVQESDAWPAKSAAGAGALMLEVLTAVEATGSPPAALAPAVGLCRLNKVDP